jgi:AcrR family transcriptional regulator
VSGAFVARTRERLRAEVLAAAEAALEARGWRGLRMVEIADTVGVSRQTLYNEFVNKTALARALALKVSGEFIDEVIANLGKADDPMTFWRDAVHYTLERAASDQRMKALFGVDGIDAFLPLFTTDGHPMIAQTGGRIAPEVCRRWPELDPVRVVEATDATSRLIISYIMLPGEPTEAVADRIAGLAIAYLKAPEHLIRPRRPTGG